MNENNIPSGFDREQLQKFIQRDEPSTYITREAGYVGKHWPKNNTSNTISPYDMVCGSIHSIINHYGRYISICTLYQ